MRKHQVHPTPCAPRSDRAWLAINSIASVEVTSEENGYPIQSALRPDSSRGWRAASPGSQTIRLIFREPQKLTRIWLAFEDTESTRTQQFLLRWSPGTGLSFREIVRQEWNFSPAGSVGEVEDYTVDLSGVGILELQILPDKKDGQAKASLRSLRLA
jgi:hypothetical protein